MCASLHTTALTALTLIASSALATAAEVRVLTVGSTQVAAKAIAADFEMQTRNQVTFTIRPPFDIDKELAEKTFDVIILSVPAMDIHDKTGSLAPTSRVGLARVGVGVVVKEGAPLPDVSTPEKLKAAVLAARSLTYGQSGNPQHLWGHRGRRAARCVLPWTSSRMPSLASALTSGGELVAKGEGRDGLLQPLRSPEGRDLYVL